MLCRSTEWRAIINIEQANLASNFKLAESLQCYCDFKLLYVVRQGKETVLCTNDREKEREENPLNYVRMGY